jgi:hypothetical protein
MRRIFYPLIAVFVFFGSIHASANMIDEFNLKNYVYDDEGNPVFIKIYIEASKKSSNQNKVSSFPLQDGVQQIINRMIQDDQ